MIDIKKDSFFTVQEEYENYTVLMKALVDMNSKELKRNYWEDNKIESKWFITEVFPKWLVEKKFAIIVECGSIVF